jgi:hypothetical protein
VLQLTSSVFFSWPAQEDDGVVIVDTGTTRLDIAVRRAIDRAV